MESETRDYLFVFRYKQHLDKQAERYKRDMKSRVAAATQKETLASQNEGLANDRLSLARAGLHFESLQTKGDWTLLTNPWYMMGGPVPLLFSSCFWGDWSLWYLLLTLEGPVPRVLASCYLEGLFFQ